MDEGKGVAWRLHKMVREAAARLGLSEVEVSERAGVSRTTLYNLDSQPNPPQARTVRKLADALGLDPDDALKASRGEDPDPPKPRTFEDPAAQAIWDLPLPESERQHFLQEYWSRLGSSDQRRRTG